MIIHKSERRLKLREAMLGLAAVLSLLAVCTLGVDAQVVKDQKDQPEAKAAAKPEGKGRKGNLEVSGFTRPGNPDDSIDKEGSVVAPVALQGDVKKFKI